LAVKCLVKHFVVRSGILTISLSLMTLTELGCCRRITGQLYRGNILQSYVKTRITQFIATMTL